MRPRFLLLVLPLVAGLAPTFDAAAIEDEIQVYTDELNERGERGLELHLNTTPRGRKTPDYAGDLPPYRGLRITPEFSRGLGGNLEAGLYLPMATDADGQLYLGGAKARLKWLPVHGSEEEGGWYFGANTEVSRVTRKFSESPLSAELRVIGGYRARDWLIGMNPIFGWGLSPGHRGSPDFTLAWKAVHKVAPGIALGGEYYDGIGTLGDRLPRDQQDRTLYFVMDFDRKPWVFNLGIGHGLTPASDNWTIKAIFEIPFD
ncbi:MAG: hypothetical protein WA373_14010 [Burkholderiales bacterium]